MNIAESEHVIAALVAAYPRTLVSAETVQLYTRFLADATPGHGLAAVAMWIASEKFFPTISELRAAIEREGGAAAPDVDQALAEVNRAIAKWGSYGTPRWSHPAIAFAVESITWRETCLSDNPEAFRAHFTRSYEAAKKRTTDPLRRQLVAKVVGEIQQRLIGVRRKELTDGGV